MMMMLILNKYFLLGMRNTNEYKKKRYDNFGNDEYYPITKRGELQAKLTGKYLKQFGEFDADLFIAKTQMFRNCQYNYSIHKSK